MRFNEKRAKAFAEYAIHAFLKDAKKKKKPFVKIARTDFSAILNTGKLHPEHIDFVRKCAAEYDIAMVNMGHCMVFFDIHEIDSQTTPLDAKNGCDVTGRFEKVYGSEAADEMWEEKYA